MKFNKEEELSVFFQENKFKYTPRALLFDFESAVINDSLSEFPNLFNPANIWSGKEDASSNFARGKYDLGKSVLEEFLDKVRKNIENCENL